jgi:hypothetical protein
MVNYGKFFNDGKDEWKPYRHLVSGEFMGLAGYTAITPAADGYSDLSMVSKIAKSTGAFKGKGKVGADFDIGEILGLPFTMDIEVSSAEKDGKYYTNVKAKNPSSKHKAIPVPKHDIEPVVVFFDDENDDDAVSQLRYSVIKRLEMAEGWDNCALKVQLEKLGKLGDSSKEESSEEEEAPKKTISKKATSKPTPAKQEEADEDDDNPFDMDDE